MQRKTTEADALMEPWIQSLVHRRHVRMHMWILTVKKRRSNMKPRVSSLNKTHSTLFCLQDRHQHQLTEEQKMEFFQRELNQDLKKETWPVCCKIKTLRS